MHRFRIWLVLLLSLTASGNIRAGGITLVWDNVDSISLVNQVFDLPDVTSLRGEIEQMEARLEKLSLEELERRFGKPIKRPNNKYAISVSEPRLVLLPGVRSGKNPDKREQMLFFPIDDIGGFEIWFNHSGDHIYHIITCFSIDEKFRPLDSSNLEFRLAWEGEKLEDMLEVVEDKLTDQ